MNIRRYVLALRRAWWMLILIPLIIGGSAYTASNAQTAIYASHVRIVVGQTLQSANPDYGSLIASERLVTTYAQLAQSRLVFEATAQALGNPDAGANISSIQVSPVQDTEFLDITVLATDPALAAQFANELANQLILKSPTGPQSSEAKIRSEIESQIAVLKEQIAQTQQDIEQLKDELGRLPTTSERRPELLTQLQVNQQLLSDDQQTLSTLYNTVLQNRSNVLNILEPAVVQPQQIAPLPLRTAILAGLLGLFVVAGLIIALQYFDDSIRTPDEIVDLLGAPLLAAIVQQPPTAKPTDRLVVRHDPRSPVAESFRNLRTNLQFSNIDASTHTLLISSAQPSDGKSTVSANLAWTLSQAGQRVILIDADLRKPMQHRIFNLDNSFGLTTLLSAPEDADTTHCLNKVAPNLTVVTSGPHPPNPSELLSSKRMEMLIWLLQQEYDWVLCDSPPVLTVTDALALAPRTDGMLLVASAQNARREVFGKVRSALQTLGVPIRGIVVNKIDERAEGYYYSYYSYYYEQHSPVEEAPRRWWNPLDRANGNGHSNGHSDAAMVVTLEETSRMPDDVDEPVIVHERN